LGTHHGTKGATFGHPKGGAVMKPEKPSNDMQYTKVELMVFDMEGYSDAKDYATVLVERLERMETNEGDELQVLSRIALWLLNAVRGTNEDYAALFVEVIRKGKPLSEELTEAIR
jgi:hypothetical protein